MLQISSSFTFHVLNIEVLKILKCSGNNFISEWYLVLFEPWLLAGESLFLKEAGRRAASQGCLDKLVELGWIV